MLRKTIITLAGTVVLGSVFIGTGVSAAASHRHHRSHHWNHAGSVLSDSRTGISNFKYTSTGKCKIVGAISHRCLNFHSDATWPGGLSDYHGSN
ncbi:MAG: hypothetical protein ABSG76_03960 [Xanthobacteraceae bacterium]|jgi:hypothetical protein